MSTTLFTNVTALTMDDQKRQIKNGYVLVVDGKIKAITDIAPSIIPDVEVSCEGKLMLPGFVNAHTHIPMTLLRGIGGGNNLQDWLNHHIFPAEARLDARAIRAGTNLAIADLLAGGVTSIADMYSFCDDMADCLATSGINANISRGIICFSPEENPSSLVGVQETLALIDKWHNHNKGQLKIDLSLHGEYTSFMAPKLWEYMAKLSQDRQLPLHIHCSETKIEHEECKERHGKTPFQILDQYGLWNQGGLAAHCVWTEPEDWALMAKRGVSPVHNPISNLKLGSGIAPVDEMLKAGVHVALGTDSVASNNSHDLLEEVKLTAMLHKGISLDPLKISSYEALDMATRQGGIALQRPTGQITEGYDADIILLDVSGVSWTPCHDLVENVVFSSRGTDVVLTMCRGKVLYEYGNFYTLELDEILKEVKEYGVPCILGTLPS